MTSQTFKSTIVQGSIFLPGIHGLRGVAALAVILFHLVGVVGLNAFFICASVITVLILVFAEFTYRFVEVPGINLGRKVIAHKSQSLAFVKINNAQGNAHE